MADKVITPNGKQRLSSPERRAAIVDAALHLFAEKGFRGTTTRELAARVGVSEPVLYEHFRTKRDLYTAIMDAKIEQVGRESAALFEHFGDSPDVRRFFTEFARAIVAWYEHDPDFVRLLLFSGLENHELRDIFYERHSSRFFEALADYMRRRIAEGTLRAVDPLLAARAFFGMIAHYCLTGIVFSCAQLEMPKDQVLTQMVDIFLYGTCGQGDARE